ncbi:MAG: sulfatase-like hydrolase/transferase [Akkermansiaceae bacterium]
MMKKLSTFLAAAVLSYVAPLGAETPNIIIILVDDMGYGDLKSYNANAKTATPNLDSLAANGMRFTDAHTNSAVCTPTRYGLLTGRYAWRTRLKSGVLDGSSRRLIAPTRETIASLLKKKNYRTASVGKWHLGMTDTGGLTNIYQNSTDAQRQLGTNDVGFDYWYGIPASLDHIPYTVVESGNLVNMTNGTDSPAYNTWGNQPGSPSPRFIRAGKIAPGFDFEKLNPRFETKIGEYIADHVANHSSQPFFLYNPIPGPHAPWVPDIDTTGLTPEQIYIAYIDQIDSHVGAIIDRLDDPNNDGNNADSITNDTLIIFTSDNGADSTKFSEASSGHDINLNWRGQKADIHEGGHRVPFLVKWPGKITPSVSSETICMTDIFATIADIVEQNYAIDAGEDSYSFSRVLLGQPFTSPIRGPIVHHSLSGMFAIREGDWKLIFGTGSGGFSGAAGEGSNSKTDNTPQRLYNLASNPAESLAQNQLSAEPAVVTDLHAKLDAIRDNPRSAPHPDLLDDDDDGMSNGFEDQYGLDKTDPNDADIDGPDGDGLTNLQEFNLGTDPTKVDSDGDKRPDGVEDANQNGVVDAGESNPALRDTDDDGIDDLVENAFGTDFNNSESFPLPSSSNGACLILDAFENGNPSTANAGENGGVQLVKNSVAAGEGLSETGGLLTINTGSGSDGNVGAASLSAIDFAGSATGVRLTWEIDSISARPQANGLFLGFSTGTAFYRSVNNLGLIFFGKSSTASTNGFSLVRNDSDSPVGPIIDSGANVQLASLLDGFTATLDITPAGFSYRLTGLKNAAGDDTVFSAAKTWTEAGLPANFYSTLGSDERHLTSVQRGASNITLKLAEVKVEKIAPQPFRVVAALSNESGTSAIALVWNSESGKTYRIERSEDLSDWTDIVATAVPSSGARTSFLHEDAEIPPGAASRPRWFYRVVEE